MFERISKEAKDADTKTYTNNRRSYSTLPRSFRQTDVQGALDGVRVAIAQSRVFVEPQQQASSPPSSPIARPKRTLTTKASAPSVKRASTQQSESSNSNATNLEVPFDWVISTQKSHQIFDTIRYIKENQQRYNKCVSGPDKVDQIKLQTLLQTNQMFIELLEKQATELVSIIQRLQETQSLDRKQQLSSPGAGDTSAVQPQPAVTSSLSSPPTLSTSASIEQVLEDLNNHSEPKETLYITKHTDKDDLSKALQALQ